MLESCCYAHTFYCSPPTLLPSPQPAVYKFTNPVQHSGFEGFTVRFNWYVFSFFNLLIYLLSLKIGAFIQLFCSMLSLLGSFGCILLHPSALSCIVFRRAPYPAHMRVEGMNGFWFYGSANAWVRDVHIVNAE